MLDVFTLSDAAARAREAASRLAIASSAVKDRALQALADALLDGADRIVLANAADVADAETAGMEPSFVDRLLLTPQRIRAIAGDVRHIVTLSDPVGEEFDARALPNG